MKFTVRQDWVVVVEDDDDTIDYIGGYGNATDAQSSFQEEHPEAEFIGPKRWPDRKEEN